MVIDKYIIPLQPVTKKNSSRIIRINNYPKILPSKAYCDYENNVAAFMYSLKNKTGEINFPINLKCVFYVNVRRKSDLVGFLQAIQDVLVKYHVLADDCRDIVASTDGSVVLYDKINPRTEITISRIYDYQQWNKKYGGLT